MISPTSSSSPPSFPDIYGKIGKTIFFPAGAYYIADGGSFTCQANVKVVGHQYLNSNLASAIIIETTNYPDVYFTCQELRDMNITTQGSGYAYVYIESINISGCNFGAPIDINPFPDSDLGAVTIQGCQFDYPLYVYNGNPGNAQLIINGSRFSDGIGMETSLTDLVINECYYKNSSGDFVIGIPPVAVYNSYSIAAMSPSTKAITLTSGTSATNPAYLLTGTIRIPVTLSPTSTAAATVSVAITDQYGNSTTTTMASAPAGSTAGIVQTITFDVPPQASYTVTATNATLETGTISYNATAISLNATSLLS